VRATGTHKAVGLNPAFLSEKQHQVAAFESSEMLASMEGKTCLITGANVGLGLETSRWLFQRGCTVIAAGRREANIKAACHDIVASSSKELTNKCLPKVLDLASLKSVRDFATDFLFEDGTIKELDVLVLNAGITFWKTMGVSKDNVENMFHTNHLGHFYLVQLLAPALSPPGGAISRVVVVSSAAHYGPFPTPRGVFTNLDELNDPSNWDGIAYYAQSKLANVLFTQALSRRLNSGGRVALVNAASPGMTKTNVTEEFRIKARAFAGESPILQPLSEIVIKVFNSIEKLTTWDTADGARTQIYLAVAPEIERKRITGRYFHPQAIEVPPSELAQGLEGERLSE
jgi:NAD(P)-dependent dehydrogenase (short-subunit alcohol dehydrogenase family)